MSIPNPSNSSAQPLAQPLTWLNETFAERSMVQFVEESRSQTEPKQIRIDITTSRCTGSVYLHGAHVATWQPTDQPPVLFMSDDAIFAEDTALRGGVPICFPWFGPGNLDQPRKPSHGLVRQQIWQLNLVRIIDDTVELSFTLSIENFDCRYAVKFGDTLSLALEVTNTSDTEQTYEDALHSYFQISSIHDINITGLATRTYIDQLQDMQRLTQSDTPIQFTGEFDSIYLNTDDTCIIHDPKLHREISVSKTGSQSTVVWNPWIEKTKTLKDMPNDAWPNFVCIETANAKDNQITLAPGASHTTTALIETKSL